MALTQQDVQAEVAAYQPPEDKTAPPHPMAPAADAKPDPIQAAMAPPPAKTSPTFLDSVLSTVDNYTSKLAEHVANDPTVRMLRQGQAGFVKGVVNTVDSVASAAKSSGQGLAAAEDPAHAEEALNGPDIFHPAYDHARQAALDFRDAIAVKDPSIPENLAEGAGQLMPSFLMFSRVLGSIGNTAELASGAKKAADLFKFATADAATNATAIAPHDPRLSDTLALLQHSEGKFGDLLRQVAPDGVRSYIDYLADHKDEGEAEGRWKNVVDGWGTAAALTGVLHTAGSVFKQGWNALHYMADNNMGSMSDLMPANQEGKIGYHGSTADIEPGSTFDNSKIGTGEGSQAFGYGHYIAESEKTAGTYQTRLAAISDYKSPGLSDARQVLQKNGGDPVKAYQELKRSLVDAEPGSDIEMRLKAAMSKVKNGNGQLGGGNLYTVHVDDEHIANMLDHDSPLAQQNLPKPVLEVLAEAQQSATDKYGASVLSRPDATGADAYKVLSHYLGSDKAASAFLDSHGVPGIKYLDQKSRAAGGGTSNFVVFNGKNATITAKNGVGVGRGDAINMNLSAEERAFEREHVAATRDKEEASAKVRANIPKELQDQLPHNFDNLSAEKQRAVIVTLLNRAKK